MEIGSLIAAGILGLIGAFLAYLQDLRERKEKKKKAPTLQDRINELTEQLKSSATIITEIEQEISKRNSLVTQQEAELKKYELIKDLNKSQIETIAQILETPVKKESRRSFWINIIPQVLIAAGLFILGYYLGGK
jgi:flagellar biosynthesis/type III secretory pathway M-ring protein FliF/YscJ